MTSLNGVTSLLSESYLVSNPGSAPYSINRIIEKAYNLLKKLPDEISQAQEFLEEIIEMQKLLEQIIEGGNLSSSKFILDEAKIPLARLYLYMNEEGFTQKAFNLCKLITSDNLTEMNLRVKAKFMLACMLKKQKRDPAAQQEALKLFTELYNFEFKNQVFAQLFYFEVFTRLMEKESEKIDTNAYNLLLGSLDLIIGQFTQNLKAKTKHAARILSFAYYYKAKIILLNEPLIINESATGVVGTLFKAYILGDADMKKRVLNIETINHCEKINLILGYLYAINELEVMIKPELEWLLQFGNLSEFLETFAKLFAQSENDQSCQEQVTKMGNIIYYYIKMGKNLTEYYKTDEVCQFIGKFCCMLIKSWSSSFITEMDLKYLHGLNFHIKPECSYYQETKESYLEILDNFSRLQLTELQRQTFDIQDQAKKLRDKLSIKNNS